MEGWVVGLLLISVVLRQAQDPDSALRTLRGGIQYAREFLIQEVINNQTPDPRDWLLKTSILDRFCPRLCDAVCGAVGPTGNRTVDGEAFIRTLQECNLFAIALDRVGEWFRYHHLFQDLLRAELARRETPEEIGALHALASRWLEAEGLIE